METGHVFIIIEAIEIRVVEPGSSAYDQVLLLRRRVLRWPLGLDFTQQDLDSERCDVHLAGFDGGEPVACAVLTDVGGIAKMRQVAVDPDRQRSGLGRRIVEAFEGEAVRRGYSEIVLNAREAAVPFYLSLGYEVTGELVEVGIPHRSMRKRVAGPGGSFE